MAAWSELVAAGRRLSPDRTERLAAALLGPDERERTLLALGEEELPGWAAVVGRWWSHDERERHGDSRFWAAAGRVLELACIVDEALTAAPCPRQDDLLARIGPRLRTQRIDGGLRDALVGVVRRDLQVDLLVAACDRPDPDPLLVQELGATEWASEDEQQAALGLVAASAPSTLLPDLGARIALDLGDAAAALHLLGERGERSSLPGELAQGRWVLAAALDAACTGRVDVARHLLDTVTGWRRLPMPALLVDALAAAGAPLDPRLHGPVRRPPTAVTVELVVHVDGRVAVPDDGGPLAAAPVGPASLLGTVIVAGVRRTVVRRTSTGQPPPGHHWLPPDLAVDRLDPVDAWVAPWLAPSGP